MDKKKGFIQEFKEFIMRGNVMDLAIAVIIGGAFQGIISSLVDDIIMPVISLLTGGIDFSNLFISLDGKSYSTLVQAQDAGAATLNYGTFINVVINFLLVAFVIFLLVKGLNKLQSRKATEAAPVTTKTCPYCKSDIPVSATRCPHCTSDIPMTADVVES